jgi:DNA-binding NtrC family response regulator
LIRWALTAANGNKSRAAELLQIKRSTLGDRIKHCGIENRKTVQFDTSSKSWLRNDSR